MKKLFLLLLVTATMLSCDVEVREKKSDSILTEKTERVMQEASREIGLPAIVNFQEKKVMKWIYELRDKEDMICYAYIINMHGKMIYLGRCIGYGLPYSTQFSSPEKIVDIRDYGINTYSGQDRAETVPQAEPNGLFMPEGLSATWLLMLDPETNEPRPVYLEPEILVSPFKMHKDV